jgi:hypothetical protein
VLLGAINPWILAGGILAVSVGTAGGYLKGTRDGKAAERVRWLEAQAEQQQRYQEAVALAHRQQLALERGTHELEKRTLETAQKLQRYNSSTKALAASYAEIMARVPDGDLWLGPCGVRIINEAAAAVSRTFANPQTPCPTNAADWRISVNQPAAGYVRYSAAIATIVGNYAIAGQWRSQALGLQDYARLISEQSADR